MSFPTKEDLTLEMQKCFHCKADFICTWVPWTWKTVVAFHKFNELRNEWKRVKFICYNRLLNNYLNEIGYQAKPDIRTIDSWTYEMRRKTWLFSKYNCYFLDIDNDWVKEIFSKYVEMLWHKFDWIVIDEWQDLWVNFYRNSHILADNIAVFMDDHQKLKWTSILIWDVETQLYEASWKTPHRFTLTRVFRSPKKVYEFARSFIPNDLVANDSTLLDNLEETQSVVEDYPKDANMYDKIFEIMDNDYSLWKTIWIFAESTSEVKQIKKDFCNKFWDERDKRMAVYKPSDAENFSWEWKILLSNYDCAKWLEFDTVILMSPSVNASDNYIANKLYTLCTRSKKDLYLFIEP